MMECFLPIIIAICAALMLMSMRYMVINPYRIVVTNS